MVLNCYSIIACSSSSIIEYFSPASGSPELLLPRASPEVRCDVRWRRRKPYSVSVGSIQAKASFYPKTEKKYTTRLNIIIITLTTGKIQYNFWKISTGYPQYNFTILGIYLQELRTSISFESTSVVYVFYK